MENLSREINIFIATHKTFEPPKQDIYIPIQAGSSAGDLGYLRDDQYPDNISHKNRYYSEMTALYAIWKYSTAKIIGLTHYRRYFINKPALGSSLHYPLINKTDVLYLMQDFDIIIPKSWHFGVDTMKSQYCRCHYEKDWILLKEIVFDIKPEYISTFEYCENQNYLIPWNMFIGKKEIMNLYFDWVFDILFELEKRSEIQHYDSYQERLMAFASERLFTVWLHHHQNQFKLLQMDVIGIVDNQFVNAMSLAKTINE